MATNIYLGYPPENIRKWIIADAERKYQELLKTPLTFTAKEDSSVAFGCWELVDEEVYDEETGEYTYISSQKPYIPEYNEENEGYYYGESGNSWFKLKLDYSIDNGNTWQTYNLNQVINLSSGENVMFRANDYNGIRNYDIYDTGYGPYVSFCLTGNLTILGNIMSLLSPESEFIEGKRSPDGERCYVSDYEFCQLFAGNDALTSASKLILPCDEIHDKGYCELFMFCTNLIDAPELPATNIYDNSYGEMFMGCHSLTKAPKILPAKQLYDGAYFSMFNGCNSLTKAPKILAEEILGNDITGYESLDYSSYDNYAMNYMFADTSIRKISKLPKIPYYYYEEWGSYLSVGVMEMLYNIEYAKLYFTFEGNTFDEVLEFVEKNNIFGSIYSEGWFIEETEIVCSDKTMIITTEEKYNEYGDIYYEIIITEK